jgi:LysM repeat protein
MFIKKLLIMGLVLLFGVGIHAQAQAPNLLTNGNMEGGFSARDGVTGVPLGWGFVKIAGKVDADRQAFAPYAYSAPTFWTMRSTYSTFQAVGYQPVSGVTPNVTYRAGAYVWVWTCNDAQWSCIPSNAPRFSHQESGARARIGIDPLGGNDPNSGNVVWGPWVQSFDKYTGITIDAVAKSTNLTVFLMVDSGQAMAFNEFYWDDAFLQAVTPAPNQATGATGSIQVDTSNFVPFVEPQQVRPDGSVVHVVKEGDTLDSIAVAYNRAFGITKAQIIETNGWRFPPQFIRIGQEILIFPPGSVDPVTGQLNPNALAGLSQPAHAAQPAQVTPPTQTTGQPAAVTSTTQNLPTAEVPTVPTVQIVDIPAVEAIAPFLP